MHYVYILHSEAADKFYVGQTPDLETRLLFHNELSENSFTSRYRPWKLAKAIAVNNRSEAMIIEKHIKGRKSKAYTIKLINEEKAVKDLLNRFNILPPNSVG